MPHSLGQHTELTIPSNISLRLESYAIPIEVIRLLAVISITKSLGVVSLKVRKISKCGWSGPNAGLVA